MAERDAASQHEVIESIISLTEQREQHSLEASLISSLREMVEDLDGWILEVSGEHGAALPPYASVASASPPARVLEAAGRVSVDAPPLQLDADGRRYLLLPLYGNQGLQRVLALARPDWRDEDLRVVSGMTRVYRNFIALLFESEKDTLTGLYNRRKLEAKLSELLAAHLRGRRGSDRQHPVFLAVIDLDHFKRINDKHGHLIGDEVLLVFADLLQRTLRENDLLFRYGGEEFIVILQDTAYDDAQEVLERLRQQVATHAFPQVDEVTVSIGYAAIDGHHLPTEVIEEADRALYYAKENGRNQVCEYWQLVASGKIMPIDRQAGSIELF